MSEGDDIFMLKRGIEIIGAGKKKCKTNRKE